MQEDRRKYLLSKLVQVDSALRLPAIAPLMQQYGRDAVTGAVREVMEMARRQILSGTDLEFSEEVLKDGTLAVLEKTFAPSLCRVVNATGIIIHTGLGRAVMPRECLDALNRMASGYCLLEMGRESGKRSDRMEHVEKLLKDISGAEAAHVVNNDAAAVMLTLRTLAHGRDAVCSRAEQVEIGGSFRLPEIITNSGVGLIDIGTTNRTYISDYENAMGENTGVIIKAHTSNYRLVGFVTRPSLEELVEVGCRHGVPVVYDIGSGAFVHLSGEPTVQEAIATGVDVVCFSGDKLLGGPQSGIILGKERILSRIKKDPMARAVRVGKVTLILLEALLKIYLNPETIAERIPAVAMYRAPLEDIAKRARAFARKIRRAKLPWEVEVVESLSELGGGSTPGKEIPSMAVALSGGPFATDEMALKLRMDEPCIFPYTREDRVLFDLRTMMAGDEALVLESLKRIAGSA
jgi:L-seryl-tRNA(Ser) seleniumtransferase